MKKMKYVKNYNEFLALEHIREATPNLQGLDENASFQIADKIKKDDMRIIKKILSYTNYHKPKSDYSSWYIGTTNNLEIRTSAHKSEYGIKELPKLHSWECQTAKQAQNIEKYMIEKYKFDGALGNWTPETNIIYVFYKGHKKSLTH